MSKMFLSAPLFRIRGQPRAVWGFGNDGFRFIALENSKQNQNRFYSKSKEDGEDTPQVKSRHVEKWPKPFQENHPPWKTDCPVGPPPPNNDPYRIKVPEVVVPPLPQPCAKEMASDSSEEQYSQEDSVFKNTNTERKGLKDLFHNSAIVHPDYWKEKPEKVDSETIAGESTARLGYHGRAKYQFAFHEPWKPLDRLALLAQAEKAEKEQLKANIEESFPKTKKK